MEEERIRRLEEIDQLKDQFLANTSHELRTPLNGIIGMAEVMQERGSDMPENVLRDNLTVIIAAGKRLNNLVNDILDFSRLKNSDLNLDLKPVDMFSLVDVVVQISQPMMKGKKLIIHNRIPEDLPMVMGDENRIYQILYNLVGNAIKFTERGEISISASEKDGFLAFTIADTGIGIPEEKQERIFQSFEQADASASRSYQGTGLGLSITRHLVELHRGKIFVESDGENGSAFTFTLPLAEEEAGGATSVREEEKIGGFTDSAVAVAQLADASPSLEPAAVPETSIPHDPNKINILIVDDEPINLHVLSNHLTAEHYRIELATNGPEALELIQAGHRFDLVVLDIMMPKMSGYEVCRVIRESYLPNELPVIMVTAKNQVKDLVEGLNLGANDYLAKPYSREEIMARIKTQLNLLNLNKVTGRFVPNAFLKSLGRDNITEVRLGDQVERQVTVFFSDIRGYTLLSEQMTPEENFRFVSSYNRRFGPIITENNGFINQYLGDGIMAIFSKTPDDALAASVNIQRAILAYNQERRGKSRLPIRTGIGFHTGPLIMGIIGDESRMDATTISDTVNTASRIESLNKYYATNILFSEASLQQLQAPDAFPHRYMGQVQMKGKEVPVGVYECFAGDEMYLREQKMNTLDLFNNSVLCYFARDFRGATEGLEEVLALNSEDKTARMFLNKALAFLASGVPDDWSGIEKMDKK